MNKNEQSKKDDNPLNVRNRILYTYCKRGFDSIDPADLRGRFRWMGLYTQRAPGFDGGKTAHARGRGARRPLLHDARAHRRTDPGRRALRALGESSTKYARDTADITDRNNIQYHWIEIEDVPAIWERLEAVGLITIEACGDCPRPFLGSPVAGIAKDEIIDGSEALAEIKRRALNNPEFSNLPRKFKTALTGHPSHDVAPEVNDVVLRRHRPPRARPRLRPVGRWRPVDQPDARAEARCLDPAGRGAPTRGRPWPASTATTATAGCARRPA